MAFIFGGRPPPVGRLWNLTTQQAPKVSVPVMSHPFGSEEVYLRFLSRGCSGVTTCSKCVNTFV